MERNIPHVLDIFVSSPGERRRMLFRDREDKSLTSLKEQQKNPGSDSAVCLCSSSDEDERNISKYFDYLDEDLDDDDPPNSKKKKNPKILEKSVTNSDKNVKNSEKNEKNSEKNENNSEKNEKNAKNSEKSEDRPKKREPRYSKDDLEKDIKQIERHLSMKKTIRKKMMRDLQQAFVEDPKEFEQDPSSIPPDKKSNINIQNLTISKKRLSKSEHSFLDMLKENDIKDRKGSRGHGDGKSQKFVTKRASRTTNADNDSGNDSPTREATKKQVTTATKTNPAPPKEEKKSLWQRLTGKGKTKR